MRDADPLTRAVRPVGRVIHPPFRRWLRFNVAPCPRAKAVDQHDQCRARARNQAAPVEHCSCQRPCPRTDPWHPPRNPGDFRRHEPAIRAVRTEGFEGAICYELRRHNGAIIEGWALRITALAARASFGFPTEPATTLKLTVGDFVRFNLGAVSPVTLLTEERLKLDGDLTVAAKLAPMFGRPLPQS